MIYVIKLKGRDMYLREDGAYTTEVEDADCFFDFAEAKSYVSGNEEVLGIEGDTRKVFE